MTISLYMDADWKAIAKMTLLGEDLRAASSPVRWTLCTKI